MFVPPNYFYGLYGYIPKSTYVINIYSVEVLTLSGGSVVKIGGHVGKKRSDVGKNKADVGKIAINVGIPNKRTGNSINNSEKIKKYR